jgi:hypothetical protein
LHLNNDTEYFIRPLLQNQHQVSPILSGLKIIRVRGLDAHLVIIRHINIELPQKIRRRVRAIAKKQDHQLVKVGNHTNIVGIPAGRAVAQRASLVRLRRA